MRPTERSFAAELMVAARVFLSATCVIACSDPTGVGDAPGTFSATLRGAIARAASGAASLVILDGTYRVELFPKDNAGGADGFRLTVLADGARPSVGTYAVVPGPGMSPQPPTVFAAACVDAARPCFTNWRVSGLADTAGRLAITRSSTGGVVGSLEVDLDGDGNEFLGAVLHVSARFNATCTQLSAGGQC